MTAATATLTQPLKEAELRTLTTCAVCDRKLGKTNLPILWKVSIERHILNAPAVSRQNALGLFLGSGALASVMGSNEDMTSVLSEKVTVMVCDECSCGPIDIAAIAEHAAKTL